MGNLGIPCGQLGEVCVRRVDGLSPAAGQPWGSLRLCTSPPSSDFQVGVNVEIHIRVIFARAFHGELPHGCAQDRPDRFVRFRGVRLRDHEVLIEATWCSGSPRALIVGVSAEDPRVPVGHLRAGSALLGTSRLLGSAGVPRHRVVIHTTSGPSARERTRRLDRKGREPPTKVPSGAGALSLRELRTALTGTMPAA